GERGGADLHARNRARPPVAQFAGPVGARAFGPLLGIADRAGGVRADGQRRVVREVRNCAAAGRDGAAVLWFGAARTFPKAGTGLARCAGSGQGLRVDQSWVFSVSVLVEQDAVATFLQFGDRIDDALGLVVLVRFESGPLAARRHVARRNVASGDQALHDHQ